MLVSNIPDLTDIRQDDGAAAVRYRGRDRGEIRRTYGRKLSYVLVLCQTARSPNEGKEEHGHG